MKIYQNFFELILFLYYHYVASSYTADYKTSFFNSILSHDQSNI